MFQSIQRGKTPLYWSFIHNALIKRGMNEKVGANNTTMTRTRNATTSSPTVESFNSTSNSNATSSSSSNSTTRTISNSFNSFQWRQWRWQDYAILLAPGGLVFGIWFVKQDGKYVAPYRDIWKSKRRNVTDYW
jgi:hypothetical protein